MTGKPLSQGGISGRTEATGLGVFYGTEYFCQQEDIMEAVGLTTGIPGKRVIVQGFGNVGYWSSVFFAKAGALVTGVIEWDGAVYNPDGLDIAELQKWREATGSIKDFPGATEHENDDPIEVMLGRCTRCSLSLLTRSLSPCLTLSTSVDHVQGMRHPCAGGSGEAAHSGERGQDPGAPHQRGRQRTHHAVRRGHSAQEGRHRCVRGPRSAARPGTADAWLWCCCVLQSYRTC